MEIPKLQLMAWSDRKITEKSPKWVIFSASFFFRLIKRLKIILLM